MTIRSKTSREKAQAENRDQEVLVTAEIGDIRNEITKLNEILEQKKSTPLKADFFVRYTLLHATSGDPNVMVRRITRTSSADSGAVTRLEIWHQSDNSLCISIIVNPRLP